MCAQNEHRQKSHMTGQQVQPSKAQLSWGGGGEKHSTDCLKYGILELHNCKYYFCSKICKKGYIFVCLGKRNVELMLGECVISLSQSTVQKP